MLDRHVWEGLNRELANEMSMTDVFKSGCIPTLLAGLAFLFLATSAARPRYTNSWAVEVRGGPEIGNLLAHKHGFINHGQVNLLVH